MAGDFPIIVGERSIDLAVFIDNTWIEWFVQQGRFAQTVAVPAAALNGGFNTGAQQGIRIFTNATAEQGGVTVESAVAWHMRSIWRNAMTHDRPGPP